MDIEQEFDPIEFEDRGIEAEVPEDEEIPEDADSEEEVADEDDSGEDESKGREPTQSRANSRIRTLTSREKAAKERAEKAEQSVADLRRQMEEVQRNLSAGAEVRNTQAEAELLANMDPLERVQYEAKKEIETLRHEMRRSQFQASDSTDRATFLAKAQSDPTRSRLADQVEKNLADMRAKGINAPREEIYYYLLGKTFAEQKAKSNGKNPAKQAAQDRVDATRGRSSSARGDAPAGGRKGKSAAERLDGVLL